MTIDPDVVYTRTASGWTAKGRDTLPLVAPDTRPTGPGYVAWESLAVSGDTLRSVCSKVTGGKVLTLPAGTFAISDFTTGYFNGVRVGTGGATGCKGVVGSGRTTILTMTPGSSTQGSAIASIIATSTNPAYILSIDGITSPELGNFALVGTAQGHEYGGIVVDNCTDANIHDLYLLGASPGSKNYPPHETFGINLWKSPRAHVTGCEIDGRDSVTGERICASPLGWNNTTDAYASDCYLHHSLTSMLTFWETTNIETHRMVMHSNGAGTSALAGHGINHENCGGVIRHYQPILQPWGQYEAAHGNTASDITANNGLHFTVESALADCPDVRIYLAATDDPTYGVVHDRGPHSSGALAVAINDSYSTGQKVTTMPRVWLGATELRCVDSRSVPSGTTALNSFIRYH